MTKVCKKCGIEKPLTEFYFRLKPRLYYDGACKACRQIQRREWQLKNPLAVRTMREKATKKYRPKYYAANRARLTEKATNWRKQHPDAYREIQRRSRKLRKLVQSANSFLPPK